MDLAYVKENMYDPGYMRAGGRVIKNDLEEVAGGWRETGFDLWEEVWVDLLTPTTQAEGQGIETVTTFGRGWHHFGHYRLGPDWPSD
jgi:hypothetical protein